MILLLAILTCIILSTISAQPSQPEPTVASLIYTPLENKKDDLDQFQSLWPLKEDAFIADLNSLQAYKWAIVLFEISQDSKTTGRVARQAETPDANITLGTPTPETDTTPTPVVQVTNSVPVAETIRTTRAPRLGAGLLDNKEALDEIEFLRKYIEQDQKLTINNQDYYYRNVCLSYWSPTLNRSVCRFPEVNIVDVLDSAQRQRLSKNFKNPSIYPYYGDRDASLGVKMLTGPILGGVEIDQATGEVRYIKSVALKYFFKTKNPPDNIDEISSQWRTALRDYVLNKHRPSSIIDFRYLDDEMMKMRLDAKSSNPNLVARLLDPTPTASSSGFWPNGMTAQLVFNRVTDLSRDAEVRAILKTLAAFENTPYTYGQEGTVCWLRAFLAWRKWLVAHLYGAGAGDPDHEESINENRNEDSSTLASPFGNFHEDLRIFLQNPNYPVYSQHVVTADLTGDGQQDVKAFRCLVTLRNMTDQGQRVKALQHLRDIAAGNGRYNISVIGVDFFPPVALSAPVATIAGFLVPLGLCIVTWVMTYRF